MDIVFSPEADDDLREILAYRFRTRGEEETLTYAAQISSAIQHLATFPLLGRRMTNIPDRFRAITIERHRVFYRLDTDQILIVRVLHGRANSPVNME